MQVSPSWTEVIQLIEENSILLLLTDFLDRELTELPRLLTLSGSTVSVIVPTIPSPVASSTSSVILPNNTEEFTKSWIELFSQPNKIYPYDVLFLVVGSLNQPEIKITVSVWEVMSHQRVVPRLVLLSSSPLIILEGNSPVVYDLRRLTPAKNYTYLKDNFEGSIDNQRTGLLSATVELALQLDQAAKDHYPIIIWLPDQSWTVELKEQFRLESSRPLVISMREIIPSTIKKIRSSSGRLILLVTNDDSIFLDDLQLPSSGRYIIDLMIEVYHSGHGRRTSLRYISQERATFRALGAIRAYRLITAASYQNLPATTPPDNLLATSLLTLIKVGIKPQDSTSLIKSLISRGMITNTNQITSLGAWSLDSPVSLTNSALLWHWIHGFPQYLPETLITRGNQLGLNLREMEINEVSRYSSIKPEQMEYVALALEQEGVNPISIIDATAHVGGDALNFLRLFPATQLIAIEKDFPTAQILRGNLGRAALILGTDNIYQTRTLCLSALDFFQENRYADLIYFDPPWGGPSYKYQKSVALYLDEVPIGQLIGEILRRRMTPLVLLKIPVNADLDIILEDLGESLDEVKVRIHEVLNILTHRVDYRLMFFWAPEVPRRTETFLAPKLPGEIMALPPIYSLFSGIMVTALLDTYEPDSLDDLEGFLSIFKNWLRTNQDLQLSEAQLLSRIKDPRLSSSKISEILLVIKELIYKLTQEGYQIMVTPLDWEEIRESLENLLPAIYPESIVYPKSPGKYYHQGTKINYQLGPTSSFLTTRYKGPLLVLHSTEISPMVHRIDLAMKWKKKNQPHIPQRAERTIHRHQEPKVITRPRSRRPEEVTTTLNLLNQLNLG
jgi:hypothetical protein